MKWSRERTTILTAVAVTLTACSDGLGPDTASFDAVETQANVQTVDAVFSAAAWESFEALGGMFIAGSPVAGALAQHSADLLIAGTMPDAEERERVMGMIASEIVAAIESPSLSLVPIISENVRGTTFVFDPTLDRYVADPELTGAPANGVRYILYAINPITREPLVDNEIGYADIIDLDSPSANGISLHFLAVSDGVTHLDYTVTTERTDESGTIAVSGSVTNGTDTLEFTINIAGMSTTAGQTVDVNFSVDIVGRNFGFDLVFAGVKQGGAESSEISLTVNAGPNIIVMERSGTPAAYTVSITVNGELFATVTGNPTGIVITGAGDRVITPEEAEALRRMLGLIPRSVDALQGLMRPVHRIIQLAVLSNVL
ncbi:MAG: hypothetical protein IH877_05145 [Gemmatimonadetes bacterium]|nr:hypothetical protein [Gemmatimonadota bacterium]